MHAVSRLSLPAIALLLLSACGASGNLTRHGPSATETDAPSGSATDSGATVDPNLMTGAPRHEPTDASCLYGVWTNDADEYAAFVRSTIAEYQNPGSTGPGAFDPVTAMSAMNGVGGNVEVSFFPDYTVSAEYKDLAVGYDGPTAADMGTSPSQLPLDVPIDEPSRVATTFTGTAAAGYWATGATPTVRGSNASGVETTTTASIGTAPIPLPNDDSARPFDVGDFKAHFTCTADELTITIEDKDHAPIDRVLHRKK